MRVVVYGVHADDAIFSIGAYLAVLDAEIIIVSPMAGGPTDPVGHIKHTTLRREHDVLTVVERADDGVIGFAEVPGVGMPARLVRAGHWSVR